MICSGVFLGNAVDIMAIFELQKNVNTFLRIPSWLLQWCYKLRVGGNLVSDYLPGSYDKPAVFCCVRWVRLGVHGVLVMADKAPVGSVI